MALHIDSSADRTYWTITPDNDVRVWITGIRLVACSASGITSFANFLGVNLNSTSQIVMEVSINGTSEFLLGKGDYASQYGLQSIGDQITASIGHKTILTTNPACIVVDIPLKVRNHLGVFLNGYNTATGKASDYIAISHQADLSGLDYVNVGATVKRVFLP